jgi:polar amino acid transport system substrate-binding protein
MITEISGTPGGLAPYDRCDPPVDLGAAVNRLAIRPLLALLTAAAVLTACSPSDDEASTSTTPEASETTSASPSADPCAKESLQTQSPGTLTIATDDPVYPPWFIDNKPDNGKGYEGAVAAAVATKLGFTADEVTWTRVPFNNVFKPTPKNWDFDINEFSITPKRAKALDFSSPYYDVSQAVVTTKGSAAAGATSLADLKGLSIGAQVGTTSFQAIKDVIAPSKNPRVYNSNNDVVKALENGQIDALVTDLPTAFYMASAQLDKGKIVGQLTTHSETPPEQFGLVLDKNSPLTACVSKAVDALRTDGTLDSLVDQWLSQGGAPVLK